MSTNNNSKSQKDDRKDSVLTVRIKPEINDILDQICDKRRMTKAAVIREYLERAKFFLIDHSSIKSLNENKLILLKRNYFHDLLDRLDEVRQIELGTLLGNFINDLARVQGRINDVNYKLNLCEEYGFFPRFIDNDEYILIEKRFGTQKFVEAFMWELIKKGEEGDFDREFITEELEDSSKLMKRYNETIQPVERDASYYAFGFAKMKED